MIPAVKGILSMNAEMMADIQTMMLMAAASWCSGDIEVMESAANLPRAPVTIFILTQGYTYTGLNLLN